MMPVFGYSRCSKRSSRVRGRDGRPALGTATAAQLPFRRARQQHGYSRWQDARTHTVACIMLPVHNSPFQAMSRRCALAPPCGL